MKTGKAIYIVKYAVLCCILAVVMSLPARADVNGRLVIFHAGSLTIPFAEIEKKFEAAHPEVDVLREIGGSTKMARLISEVGKPADIMASADYKVIDSSLVPEFADYNIRFATNQLVLCYTDKSRCAEKITKDNWYEILQKKDVVWGHSDPNLDPCGYRSLMVMQLAEKFYNQDGLYQKLIDNRPDKNIRPKSVELVNLLKTGNMDYAWEYYSVAVQHNLKFIKLNDHINLGNYAYDKFYDQAKVQVTGSKPGTFKIRRGKSCTYGITIIKNCDHPKAAEAFLSYLLSPSGGLKILEEMGQPPFVPARVPTQEMMSLIPEKFAAMVEVKE